MGRTNTQDSKDLYTVTEVANILLVNPTTVRRWIKQGVLEAITLPGSQKQSRRIKRETLENILGKPLA